MRLGADVGNDGMTVVKSNIFEDRPEGMSIRAHRRIRTEGNARVARYWHRKFLPKHFTTSNKVTYNHKPRTSKYLKRKRIKAHFRPDLVKKGGIVDNVLSGRMEQAAKRNISLRAFPTRATLTMTGPRYMTMRPYKSGQPDKGAETTKVTRLEGRELEKVNGEHYEREMKKFKSRKTTKL